MVVMSIYKNIATKTVFSVLNRSYKHENFRNALSVWNIIPPNKFHSPSPTEHLCYARQERNFHTTPSSYKVISFNLSDIGEGIREVVIKEWFVKEGDKVSQFDNICEVQSDKASVTITSRYDGVVTKLHHAIDNTALVGKPLVDIDTEDSEDVPETQESSEKSASPQSAPEENAGELKTQNLEESEEDILNRSLAIPSVRRLAKENKIKLSNIKGTGKSGRILKEDVLKYLNKLSSPKAASKEDSVQIEPVRGYRRAMIKTMTEAMKIPHFVYHDEIKVTNLVKLKEKLKTKSSELNIKITYMPFFIKATSNALFRYPVLNSRLDDAEENIIYYKNHNIAVAMDTPTGLAVPVIKDVQNKSIIEISKELIRLQDLGKQSKFSQEDLSDGTFSFSNIGAIGGTYAKPIILPPQSAIIALGSFQKLPRFGDDGSIIAEHVASFSGAADHRIIDGATMARFCQVLKEQIEEPAYLLLEN